MARRTGWVGWVRWLDGLSTRRPAVFAHEHASITGELWLDNDHLVVIGSLPRKGSRVREQLEQSCAVLADAAPRCTTVKDLGHYYRGPGSSAHDVGPDVLLVHPLGQ